MTQPLKCIATDALKLFAVLALLCVGTLAYAASVVGTVTQLSGPLLAKKADGTAKILSQKSSVEQGDTLVTEKNTYARVKFVDNSEITLRPASQLKIENFSFDEAKQEDDRAIFSLIRGGLRAVTGLLGKRSKERFGLNTPTATIGIRGTIFIVEYVPPEKEDVAVAAAYALTSVAALDPVHMAAQSTMTDGTMVVAPVEFAPARRAQPLLVALIGTGAILPRPPGLYVQVLDGIINLTNGGGTQNFTAGQFGFTPSFTQPPIVLPTNPGMQFTPPPSFSSSTAPGGTGNSGKSGNVDCEVR